MFISNVDMFGTEWSQLMYSHTSYPFIYFSCDSSVDVQQHVDLKKQKNKTDTNKKK